MYLSFRLILDEAYYLRFLMGLVNKNAALKVSACLYSNIIVNLSTSSNDLFYISLANDPIFVDNVTLQAIHMPIHAAFTFW